MIPGTPPPSVRPRQRPASQESAEETAAKNVVKIRQTALDRIRRRVTANRILAKDARTHLSDLAKVIQAQPEADSPQSGRSIRMQRIQQHKDGHQEILLLEEEEDQLVTLLSRLDFLKDLHSTTGALSRCESCQNDLPKQDLLQAAPQASTWDVDLALLICPNCADLDEE